MSPAPVITKDVLMDRGRRLALLAGFLLVTADAGAAPASDVPLFAITKSENRNFVQYAATVGPGCSLPEKSVHAYWHMLELGPGRTAPLQSYEQRAYGVTSQQKAPTVTPHAVDAMRVVLAALPDRPILVETWTAIDGSCRALSTTRIAGGPAHLSDAFVKLRAPFGVAYVLVRGWSIDGTHRVEEKIGG